MNEERTNAVSNPQVVINKTEKHWATWILDVLVAVGAGAQVFIGIILIWQLGSYQKSNELTQQSLDLNKKQFELTQKSLDLTQKSLDQTQAEIAVAQEASNISRKSLEMTNTPWVTIEINKISVDAASQITIDFTYANHSTSPAEKVSAMFDVIGGGTLYDLADDRTRFNDSAEVVLSPNETIGSRRTVYTDYGQANLIKDNIYHGKCDVDVLLMYQTPTLEKRITCEQIFTCNSDHVFDFTSTKYDDGDELEKAFFNKQISELKIPLKKTK
jgi:hypothetical protein